MLLYLYAENPARSQHPEYRTSPSADFEIVASYHPDSRGCETVHVLESERRRIQPRQSQKVLKVSHKLRAGKARVMSRCNAVAKELGLTGVTCDWHREGLPDHNI